MYFVKTPGWLKRIYSSYVWSIPTKQKQLHLTFDDGPHPVVTPFVLDQLEKWNAKATFFCIGNNVLQHPDIYRNIIDCGHAVGNHTHHHLNGWHTHTPDYVTNVQQAAQLIRSNLFRPPYGRISNRSGKRLMQGHFKIIMWDVLSGDFDLKKTPEQCSKNIIQHATSGSIIVFHDSLKAFPRLQYSLPVVLEYFTEKGYVFKKL